MKQRMFFYAYSYMEHRDIFIFSEAGRGISISLSVGHNIGQICMPGFEEWSVTEKEDFDGCAD